jgi:4'-phosphopantetheinyl transferase
MSESWTEGRMLRYPKSSEIHLWFANLEADYFQADLLRQLLSADEIERASRFKFGKDQHKYIICRGILRTLIGRYLEIDPEKVQISYSKYGKPFQPTGMLKFNLAHCRNLVLYAFCQKQEIGVDLECIREIDDAPGIASRFFSVPENEIFQATSIADQTKMFFSLWTLKEAFVKAIGDGLSYPLDKFKVSVPQENRPAPVTFLKDGTDDFNWMLYSLSPKPACVAAVAVQGDHWTTVRRKFIG